jgi:hypothetical protein
MQVVVESPASGNGLRTTRVTAFKGDAHVAHGPAVTVYSSPT